MEIIENQEMMRAMKASQYPHITKEHSDALHKHIHEKAYPSIHLVENYVSPEEAMSIFRG